MGMAESRMGRGGTWGQEKVREGPSSNQKLGLNINKLNGSVSRRHLDDSFLWRLWRGGWMRMASCCSSWSGLPL